MSVFIENIKELYKKLKPCYCPSLEETVHFKADGLNHLLYNRRRPRNHDEKHYRVGLIPYIVTVITNSTKAKKDIKSEKPLIVTWKLEHEIKVNGKKQIVKVILQKKGVGKLTFLSAMSRKINLVKKKLKELIKLKKPRINLDFFNVPIASLRIH